MHQQRTNKQIEEAPREGAVPGYLLDRKQADRGKVLSNTIKQKKKQRAGKWDVPLPKGTSSRIIISVLNKIDNATKKYFSRCIIVIPMILTIFNFLVRPISEYEMFGVVKSGKRKKKEWKRVVRKVTFVGDGFTRKPPKFERFIRPAALRFKKAHVTHPELKATFYLDILGVKKNPQSPLYTSLGVITKGTILEVCIKT